MARTRSIQNYRQDERDRRITENVDLVNKIAYGIAARLPRRVDSADLVGAGMMGLVRAAETFEPGRGVEFRVYARAYIRGAVMDHLRAQDPVPYSTRAKIRRLEKTFVRLQKTLQRMPTEAEVAADLGITEAEVAELSAQASATSLMAADEVEASAFDADPRHQDDVLTRLEQDEMRNLLVGFLKQLPEAERQVMTLYYYENLKMREIGEVLGISESRVSQIHRRAVVLLRGQLKEKLAVRR